MHGTMTNHDRAGLEDLARRDRERRAEQKTLARHKRRIEERLKERQWPLDATTGLRADVDPEDVRAPLPEGIKELTPEDRAAAVGATLEAPQATDEHLAARRRREALQARVAREAVRGDRWTEDLVEARVEEAFRTLFRSDGGRAGPRQYGNAMPPIVREMADLVAQAGNKSLRKAVGRLLRQQGPPSQDEVRRMNETLAWSMLYLKDYPADLATFLNLGGMWKAWGAKVTRKCEEIGVHRQTFYRDRKAAVKVIVEGLKRDGKAPT